MAHMKKKFWHVSNGKLFTGGNEGTAKAYVARLRRAYGNLLGVRVYEAIAEDADVELLLYDIPGHTHPETKAKIERQWRRVRG